jgi:YidC/Oxa1 family membrane protein insertase
LLFSAPQVRELQQRHSGHPDKLQRELAALREREGTGIFAACLPLPLLLLLLLLPFFSVMYRLFLSPAVAGRPNGLLGHTLLGAPLGAHWLSGSGPLSAQGLVFAGLYLLTTTTWTVTERRLLRRKASQLRAPKPPRRGSAPAGRSLGSSA